MFFGGKTFLPKCHTFSCYCKHKKLSNSARITSIGVHMQTLCHLEVDLHVFTPIVQEDPVLPCIIDGKRDSHLFVM